MGLKIRDYQVKKNIRWHILRLLRLGSRTRQELIDKLSAMYLGYWHVNNKKEKALEEYDAKYISKEGCAKHSLWANVGLSALEFVIFIFFGGYELIYESRKLKRGEDPKLEKISSDVGGGGGL